MEKKAYTDLEQSKKLAEILPLESADAYYEPSAGFCTEPSEVKFGDIKYAHPRSIRCWSLAALLDVLPVLKRIGYEKAKPNIHFNVFTNKWVCNSLYYTSDSYDNPIDAVFEMIVKLKELNLL